MPHVHDDEIDCKVLFGTRVLWWVDFEQKMKKYEQKNLTPKTIHKNLTMDGKKGPMTKLEDFVVNSQVINNRE